MHTQNYPVVCSLVGYFCVWWRVLLHYDHETLLAPSVWTAGGDVTAHPQIYGYQQRGTYIQTKIFLSVKHKCYSYCSLPVASHVFYLGVVGSAGFVDQAHSGHLPPYRTYRHAITHRPKHRKSARVYRYVCVG